MPKTPQTMALKAIMTKDNVQILIKIVVVIIVVIIIFQVWKMISNKAKEAFDASRVAGDINQVEKEAQDVANKTGVSVDDVMEGYQIAVDTAKALETYGKGINGKNWFSSEDEQAAINSLNECNGSQHMIVVDHYYKNKATDSRDLLADLQKFLTNKQREQIHFLHALN